LIASAKRDEKVEIEGTDRPLDVRKGELFIVMDMGGERWKVKPVERRSNVISLPSDLLTVIHSFIYSFYFDLIFNSNLISFFFFFFFQTRLMLMFFIKCKNNMEKKCLVLMFDFYIFSFPFKNQKKKKKSKNLITIIKGSC